MPVFGSLKHVLLGLSLEWLLGDRTLMERSEQLSDFRSIETFTLVDLARHRRLIHRFGMALVTLLQAQWIPGENRSEGKVD